MPEGQEDETIVGQERYTRLTKEERIWLDKNGADAEGIILCDCEPTIRLVGDPPQITLQSGQHSIFRGRLAGGRLPVNLICPIGEKLEAPISRGEQDRAALYGDSLSSPGDPLS